MKDPLLRIPALKVQTEGKADPDSTLTLILRFSYETAAVRIGYMQPNPKKGTSTSALKLPGMRRAAQRT